MGVNSTLKRIRLMSDEILTKTCSRCKTSKTLDSFQKFKRGKYGLKSECKDCTKIRSAAYYEANKDRILKRHKIYRDSTAPQRREAESKYYKNNKRKVLDYKRDRAKSRYHSDPLYRLQCILSKSIRQALTGPRTYQPGSYIHDIIGLSAPNLKEYLLQTFRLRYGEEAPNDNSKVEIDHIIPKSEAKDEDGVKSLNHYTNLQLLLKEDHLEKRVKRKLNT